MTPFFDNFQPDPEMPDERWIWRTAKPLLQDAVVTYAPFNPEYVKLKVSKSHGPSNDPGCPSARDASAEIDVVLYAPSGKFSDLQAQAWNYLLKHRQRVEVSLRRKLFAVHTKSLQQLIDEELPEASHLQKYWNKIEKQVTWDAPSAIDSLFKLVSIGLATSGLDECGFTSFEFQSGWDRDHGLGILMHKDRVLAADGTTQLICGNPGSIAKGAKYVQQYDLDDGDYVL